MRRSSAWQPGANCRWPQSICCPTRRLPIRCAIGIRPPRTSTRLAFDTTATGQFLPLVRIDNTLQPPQTQTWFGLPAYVGETRTFGETGEPIHEAIASLGAVLGGTLVGVDKTTGPYNWVAMSREYYVDRNSQFVVLNTPFSVSGQSAWYETYPSILFYSIADRYPGEASLQTTLNTVDARFYVRREQIDRRWNGTQFQSHGLQFQHPTTGGQRRVARARHGIGNGLVAARGLLAESRCRIRHRRPHISTRSIGAWPITNRHRATPTTRYSCPSAPTPPPA